MLRFLILAVCATAFTLAACGRQVTPDRPGTNGVGLLPGFAQVRFTAGAPLDFQNVAYIVAFNTSGTGGEPYAINGNQTRNWQDYSFEIVLGGGGGIVQPTVFQFITQNRGGGSVKVPFRLQPTAQQLQFDPNCNGQGTQLCVTFDRRLFNGIQTGGSPSPSPTPQSSQWFVNWFTADASTRQPLDAPGLGGVNDTSFVFGPLDTTVSFDQLWTAAAGWPQAPTPQSQIVGGEVLNNP